MKLTKKHTNPEIVVGDLAHSPEPEAVQPQAYLGAVKPGLSKTKKVLICALLGIVMLASAGWLYAQSRKQSQVTADPIAVTIVNYDAARALDISTINILINTNPNPKKDPVAAQAKALALAVKGDYAGSLELYKAITAQNVAYEYYVNYAQVAASSGDIKLAIELYERALNKLTDDNEVSSEVKASEKEKVEAKIQLFKLEMQNG